MDAAPLDWLGANPAAGALVLVLWLEARALPVVKRVHQAQRRILAALGLDPDKPETDPKQAAPAAKETACANP